VQAELDDLGMYAVKEASVNPVDGFIRAVAQQVGSSSRIAGQESARPLTGKPVPSD
jgi:hypothetical protein